jgi:hypothetical protein
VKWASLVLLTFVTTWTIFAIKLARASSKEYLNSSVVLFTELFKLTFSFSTNKRIPAGNAYQFAN